MTRRYAVYYCPGEDTGLYRAGSWWLGRDCRSIERQPPPHCGLSPDEWAAITAAPRHYGLHATLKPPFALAAGFTRDALVNAMADLAARHAAFQAPELQLVKHEGFLALTLSAASPLLAAIADACVVDLDRFRRPADEAEIHRRRSARLTPRQDELLLRWGYPYVLDQFTFHITLTERLTDEQSRRVMPILAAQIARLKSAAVSFDDLCLFEQADDEAPFVLTERLPLGAPAKNLR